MAHDRIRSLVLLPVRWWLRRKPVALPLDTSRIRRVLILRYDAIGDMIVTTSFIDVLKRMMPDVEIDVVASPANVSLLDDDERVSSVMVFDRSVSSMMAVRSRCRRRSYDVVFNFVINKTTLAGLGAALWGGRRAVAVTILHEARQHLYDAWFNVQVAIERGVNTMAAMQVDVANAVFGWHVDGKTVPLSLRVTDAHRQRAAAVCLRPSAGRHVILNLSAGNWYRQWSVERNRAFVQSVLEAFPDVSISLLAHNTRAAMATEIAAAFEHRVTALPTVDDYRTVAAMLAYADVVVTPDTSIVHAASSMRTPVVVMYTRRATFINEWMPHGVPFRAVITEGRQDLEDLEPALVVDALGDLLRSLGEPS